MELVNVMTVTVLSVAEDTFKGKDGQADKAMYRLYMADAHGRVGYIYSATQYAPGDVVTLGLAERDGKLKLAVVR